MPFSRAARQMTTSGFTLVEMLVVAPIAMLVIAVFIGVMVTMVGSTLISQEQTRIAHDSEQALAQIEQDIRLSNGFSDTPTVATPQGINDGSAAWKTVAGSSGTLVLGQLATVTNPKNTPIKNSLFYINGMPNACTSNDRTFNAIYITYVVYYVKNNSLWRRTILPNVFTNTGADKGQPNPNPTTGNICDDTNDGKGPWQKNSCSNGSGGNCKVKDDRVADNVTSLGLTFYPYASSTTPSTAYVTASTVNVSLVMQSSIAGETLNYTGTVRARHLN